MNKIVKLHVIAIYMEKRLKELGFDVTYKVQNVYADFGQGTTHETIVSQDVNGDNKFQILTPAVMKRIENDNFNPEDAEIIVQEHAELFAKWKTPRLSF